MRGGDEIFEKGDTIRLIHSVPKEISHELHRCLFCVNKTYLTKFIILDINEQAGTAVLQHFRNWIAKNEHAIYPIDLYNVGDKLLTENRMLIGEKKKSNVHTSEQTKSIQEFLNTYFIKEEFEDL
jgi:hypothetical protein